MLHLKFIFSGSVMKWWMLYRIGEENVGQGLVLQYYLFKLSIHEVLY